MRRLLPAAALLLVAVVPPPAHASQVETIDCIGRVEYGAVSTPGFSDHHGTLRCTLGHGGAVGYDAYRTFTSSFRIDTQNNPVGNGLYRVVGDTYFADGTRGYLLHFEDVAADDKLAMVSPADVVYFGSNLLRYHVRAGYIRATGMTLTDELVGHEEIRFVAEYVYELPVR